jgi:hypothetical protein
MHSMYACAGVGCVLLLLVAVAWSDEMAQPVRPHEVWGRMVRNLVNCHEQAGNYEQLLVSRALLQCDASTDGEQAAAAVAYKVVRHGQRSSSQGGGPPAAVSLQQQQQQLLQMLQILQMQQQQMGE